MIIEKDIRRKGDDILIGIALQNAVLDILTNRSLLQNCLQMLERPHRGLVFHKIGMFGIYDITLNLHYDETLSMSVDGPNFEECRDQGAGIWFEKDELRVLLNEVLADM